ncbi:hypothetical protein FXO38_30952 [Capsicum annuum]|uniref:Uncharacterized protein n=1 Tax=Capsicum annuum TaxID=4072 RepID=A0A2G3AKF4_CAPAN|nr:hypothetical protein FXO38_30952 [Capsicum annuum]KAF3626642.1 hypothetical protein FXO37_30291 [Capsicum annuum]PHT94726.1 hypothetical protein T459_02608 [Capsicum annuum]
MKDHIKKIAEEVEKTKADYLNVVREREELKTQCQVLNKEIASVQTSLDETQKKVSAMQCKYELTNSKSEEILNALEAIINAIKSKAKKVEEMQRQVEFLRFSEAKAQKKKNF